MGKLLCFLQYPGKGKELVQCSTTRIKILLFLLNKRFEYLLNWNIPSGFLLNMTDHRPVLPIQRYCLRVPCNIAQVCPRQPLNIQGLEEPPGAPPPQICLSTSATSAPMIGDFLPNSPIFCHYGGCISWVQRVFKVFLPLLDYFPS